MPHRILKAFLFLVALSLATTGAHAQELTLRGEVVDAEGGDALPGVNVFVNGTNIGTTTDSEGVFRLEAPSPADTLVFSFVGYAEKKIPVGERTNLGTVELLPEAIESEEVVVVGYGEQERISVTGAVQTMQEPERELRTPTAQLSNSFAGQLAGVTAFQRSGEPGSNASEFYIRGISTFSGATDPLIIIDGVEASEADLNALSPEVIESFSVLKDATATAVYGARGANGVMVVETKMGQDLSDAKINVNFENSVSAPTSVPEFVDAAEYMELYNQAVLGRGTGQVPYSEEKIEKTREGGNDFLFPDVNWYNRMFKDYSMRQRGNINIRGGGDKMGYFMSATLNRSNGMLKSFDLNSYDNNITVNRYSFQNNLDADITPSTNLALKLNSSIRDYHGPAISADQAFRLVTEANPADFPVMWPSDTTSSVRFGGRGGGRFNSGYRNPFAEATSGYSDDFSSTVRATFEVTQGLDFLTEGLSFKGLASFKNYSFTNVERSKEYNQFEVEDWQNTSNGYDYALQMVGEEQDLTLGTSTVSGGDRTLYFEGRLDYSRLFAGKHNVSAMLLYNRNEYNTNAPAGDLINSLPERSVGITGRLQYGYDDTYLSEVNFGYDGSENFAPGEKFGFFPSASLGYVVSNEGFWEPLRDAISLFKLRGSWGLVGSDQIGAERFVYLSQIDLGGQAYTTGRDQNYTQAGPQYNRFRNEGITWEVGEKINLGLDLELFGNLGITVNAFREIRRNIFLERSTIPTSTGTAATETFGNLGKVRNRGFDVSTNFSGSITDELFMALKGTFSYASNEVLDIDEPPFLKHENLSQEGHSINSILALRAERLFIDQAEIDASPTQQLGGLVQPGDIKYRDVNGDGLINSDDRVRMGHPTVPEITYGFGPSFFYKGFDFSFLMQGVARTSFLVSGIQPFGTSTIRGVQEFIAEDHWSQENQDVYADYPRLSKRWNDNNTAASSYRLRNGAFLKLRNLELGYEWRNARFYVSGRNLFTISPFDRWDPERGGGSGLTRYPTQRVFNVGVQVDM